MKNHSMPIEVVLWMRTAKNSNRMKYAAYFRELIRTSPPEGAKRLIRIRLEERIRKNHPDYVAADYTVEKRYSDIMADSDDDY
jgi:hypothetical protein